MSDSIIFMQKKKTKKKEKTKDVKKNASGRRSKRKKIQFTSISVRTGYLDVSEFLVQIYFFNLCKYES